MTFITGYCRIKNFRITSPGYTNEAAASELAEFQIKLYELLKLDYPKFYKMDSQSKLGIIASEILLKSDRISQYTSESIAVVLSNANASQDADLKYLESIATAASPSLFVYTLSNIVAGEICIRNNIKGENAFFVTPSFDAQQIHEYAETILTGSDTDVCIAGWINVLQNEHDVLLYLIEKQKAGIALTHTPENLIEIYRS
jgi:hypothetical protein